MNRVSWYMQNNAKVIPTPSRDTEKYNISSHWPPWFLSAQLFGPMVESFRISEPRREITLAPVIKFNENRWCAKSHIAIESKGNIFEGNTVRFCHPKWTTPQGWPLASSPTPSWDVHAWWSGWRRLDRPGRSSTSTSKFLLGNHIILSSN